MRAGVHSSLSGCIPKYSSSWLLLSSVTCGLSSRLGQAQCAWLMWPQANCPGTVLSYGATPATRLLLLIDHPCPWGSFTPLLKHPTPGKVQAGILGICVHITQKQSMTQEG